jgi:hypothetical protein
VKRLCRYWIPEDDFPVSSTVYLDVQRTAPLYGPYTVVT